MNVRSFIVKSVSDRGFTATAAESAITRVLGNLAIAGVRGEHEATALNRGNISDLLDRLERRLGKAARVVADPKDNAPISPARKLQRKQGVPDPSRLRRRGVEVVKEDSFDPSAAESYANALRRGEDPATGAKLSEIELMPGVKALHNAGTRVVYPIPGENALPERV